MIGIVLWIGLCMFLHIIMIAPAIQQELYVIPVSIVRLTTFYIMSKGFLK